MTLEPPRETSFIAWDHTWTKASTLNLHRVLIHPEVLAPLLLFQAVAIEGGREGETNIDLACIINVGDFSHPLEAMGCAHPQSLDWFG